MKDINFIVQNELDYLDKIFLTIPIKRSDRNSDQLVFFTDKGPIELKISTNNIPYLKESFHQAYEELNNRLNKGLRHDELSSTLLDPYKGLALSGYIALNSIFGADGVAYLKQKFASIHDNDTPVVIIDTDVVYIPWECIFVESPINLQGETLNIEDVLNKFWGMQFILARDGISATGKFEQIIELLEYIEKPITIGAAIDDSLSFASLERRNIKATHVIPDSTLNVNAHQKKSDSTYLAKLHKMIAKHFSNEELKTLCFSLGVKYSDLPSEGTINKARELVSYLQRRGRISDLENLLTEERPDISWPFMASDTAPKHSPINVIDFKYESNFNGDFNRFLHNDEINLLHITCHAEVNHKSILNSYLQFSDQRYFLKYLQKSSDNIGASLIFLDIFSTSNNQPLETTIFVHSFQKGKKIQNVIVTEGTVESLAVEKFTTRFYNHFLKGKALGESLRLARWETLQGKEAKDIGSLLYSLHGNPFFYLKIVEGNGDKSIG